MKPPIFCIEGAIFIDHATDADVGAGYVCVKANTWIQIQPLPSSVSPAPDCHIICVMMSGGLLGILLGGIIVAVALLKRR